MKNYFPLLFLFLCACAPKTNYLAFSGFQQGTTYSVIVNKPTPDTEKKIDSLFREIDFTFSMFNPESLVSRINRNDTDVVTPLFEECFRIAKQVHLDTEGFYDPTVKPLVDAWGFGSGEEQKEPYVDSLIQFVGFDKITLTNNRIVKDDPRVQLDFSSIAKGFTVDKLAEVLDETDFLVEVGGEIRARGVNREGRVWRIQIDRPEGGFAHEQAAVISLTDMSVATSGNYRNWFTDEDGNTRVHTVDPHTGAMANGEILSASVIAKSCAEADGWATALIACRLLETADRLLTKAPGLGYYLIYNGGVSQSPQFPVN